MSRKTDNPPKILPPEWPRLADNPSKIGPPNWLPLEEAFQRMRDPLASSGVAKDDLYALLRSGEWPSAVRRVNANGEETCRLVPAEFWRIEAGLSVEIDANGADHIAVHYLDYSLSDGRMDFFVRAADIEREERLYPTTVALQSSRKPITPLKKTKSITPTKKAKETEETRLVSLMKGIGLAKSGLLPREVRKAVKQPYKDKYHDDPSDSPIARAYRTYRRAD